MTSVFAFAVVGIVRGLVRLRALKRQTRVSCANNDRYGRFVQRVKHASMNVCAVALQYFHLKFGL